jgi:hypothetical protein
MRGDQARRRARVAQVMRSRPRPRRGALSRTPRFCRVRPCVPRCGSGVGRRLPATDIG